MYPNNNPYQNFLNQTAPQNYNQVQPQNQYNNYQNSNIQNQSIVEVTGIDGAKSYQMTPNSRIILLDTKDPIVYIKSTDGANYPTISTYKLMPLELQNEEEKTTSNLEERLNKLEKTVEVIINESVIKSNSNSTNSRGRSKSKSNASNPTGDATA